MAVNNLLNMVSADSSKCAVATDAACAGAGPAVGTGAAGAAAVAVLHGS